MYHPTRSNVRTWLVAITALLVSLGDLAAQMPHQDGSGDITFALTGDAIISRHLSVYEEPEFLEVRRLMQNATAAFTNAEILFLDYDEEDIIPAAQSGGTYMRAAPEIAEELAWMGIDMVSLANNHTMDYGVGGLRANKRWIEAAGLVQAGAGENLAEARAPTYMDTPGGRVALISVASTFADFGRAGHQRKDLRGRPGLSPIRYETTYHVPDARFEELDEISSALDLGDADGDELRLRGMTFQRADSYGVTTTPHQGDLEEIIAAVEDAKRQANWVIVTSHSHESADSRDVAADFVREFARATIDAGADVWVGHGPHVLRGIEIYDGKPIFYSLGDFIFQNETVELQPTDNYERYGLGNEHLPAEFYDRRIEQSSTGSFPANPLIWESVVAIPEFRGGDLAEVRLHPVTLGHGLPRPQRGRPLIAEGDLARKIISDLQRLSAPMGTDITFEDGIGVIRTPVAAAASQHQP